MKRNLDATCGNCPFGEVVTKDAVLCRLLPDYCWRAIRHICGHHPEFWIPAEPAKPADLKMTNEQIEHMLPGPQWAAYRARLEQEILTARQLAKRLHGHPATIKAHVHNLKRQFSMKITANE